MIPPGIHFVYYSSVNLSQMSTAPRTGFYHNFSRGELVARRWDPQQEDVVDDVQDEDCQRLKDDLQNIDRFLGVYPYQSWPKWVSLSNRLTEATLLRLEPLQHKICSVADLVPDPDEVAGSRDEERQVSGAADPRLPPMVARPGTGVRYTSLSGGGSGGGRFPEGSDAAEITRHSMDSTFQIDQLLAKLAALYGDQVSGGSMSGQNTRRELLAEMQFAFLCFLVGQNYDSFEHWKRLLGVLCRCDRGLVEQRQLFLDFLGDLYFQLKEVPEDFFVDIVSRNNFLCSSLSTLFSNVKESNEIDEELKEKARKFEKNISKRFGWEFSKDIEDDAPVIVDN